MELIAKFCPVANSFMLVRSAGNVLDNLNLISFSPDLSDLCCAVLWIMNFEFISLETIIDCLVHYNGAIGFIRLKNT